MTTKLSSLRVTAEMDVSQYVRAAAQKVSADGDMVGSAKAVGQALAATDATASKAVPGVASLSRVWITGYGDAAKFESAVRSVGKALDRGMDPARAAAALDGVYRKFGQIADASTLAQQGFVKLAPIIADLNRHYDAVSAAADRAAASQKRAAEAASYQQQINARLGIGGSGRSAAGSLTAIFEEAETAAASLTRTYEPLIENENQRQIALKKAADVQRILNKDTLQYQATVEAINRRHDDTKKALEGAFTATGKYASGVGLARHELINLGRQAQDVFVSLASGQSPITVLIQQGTQIADVFAASRGSVMGFLGQIGPALLRLAGPIALVTTALTAMYAAFKVSGEQQTLSNSLLGAGRASGLTGGQLESLAQQSAESAQITVSNARLIGAEYVKLGQIANDNLPKLTLLTKNFAAATGQDMKGAAQEIAQALADPSRGAQGLSDKIGGLDSTTLRMIRTATEFNDKLRAQKLLMDELGRATSDAADQSLSKWDRLMKSMGLTFDKLKEGAASAVLGPDRSEEIIAARARIREIEQQLSSGRTAIGQDSGLRAEIGTLRQKLSTLEAIDQKERETARSRAESSASNKRITDGETVALAAGNQGLAQRLKLYNEAIGQANTLEKSVEELTKQRNAIGVPDSSNRERFATLTQQIKEQSEALEAQKRKVSDLQSVQSGLTMEQERARRGTEIDLKASKDKTLADAQETAAMRARNEAFGTARTQAEEDLRVKQAQREATVRGTVALNEQSKTIQDGIAVTNAQTEAYRRGGVAAAEVARIRKEAEQQARTTGGDVEVIFRERLNKEIAEAKRGLAEKVALQRQETSAANAANAAAAAGNLSAKQRTDLEERLRVEREAYNKLLATGLVTEKEAAKLAKEQADSVSRGQNARTDAAATDYIYQQNQTLETLKKQIELVGRSRDARYEELEILKAQQFLQENGISQESERGRQILANAKLIGQQNREYEIQLKLQAQIRQAQEFAADSLKSFLDELLTGTEGINGALKSLGKGFLSASLDALISGKGPLAGITGLASSTKDGQGGILGLLTTGIQGLGKQVEKGAEKGTATGAAVGISTVASNDNIAWLGGISGKDLAGGLTAIAGLAGAYGSGMAAGSYAQAVGGGALSGGMGGLALAGTSIGASLGGAAVLGPIGVIAGAALGYFGQQQARKQAREQREREAQENYKNAQPAIATMRSQLRGDPQNTLKIQIAEAEAATRKLTDVMFFAKKYDEERETYLDFKKYEARLLSEYRDGFIGMIQSMEAGLGPNSPFAQAKSAVADFGKELQGFIENAETAFGQGTPQVDQARQASIAYAVSVLDGAKSLTLVQQRMQEIQGTGAGLVKVLVDLGVASEQAGEAVTAGVAMAVQRLRDTFETDLQAKTNEALDKGYLNDARSLLLEIQQLATDSRTLGTDPGNITRYFQAAAQNLVNEANLTGDAFTEFLALFPEFTGNVVAAGQALEDASRRLGYLDRLFAATNDTSTLAGQLAAYDRQAMREREEEIKLGGQYILELEAAQQAERYNIIRDFNKAANDNYRQSLQQAQDYVARFTRSIQEYLDGLRAGSDSPLSPQARLAAAQSQYNAQLVLAQGGDRNALDGITSYASDLIDAAKGFFASSTGFQDIFAQIQSQLGALPSQISAEQFIVNAIEAGADQTVAAVDAMKVTLQSAVSSGSASEIAAALSTYFNRIDSNTSASIDFNEMRSALGGMASDSQLRDMFTRIDTDNSGSISRLEAINTATGQVRASNLNQESSLATANQIAQSVASLNNSINQNIATGNGILYEVRNATNAVNQSSLASSTYSDLIVRNLRSQAQNWGAQNVHGYAIPFFRDGGLIGGRGTGTSDSNLIRASRGEFMMSERATNFFGPGMLSQMNDNLAMPAMPVPVMGGGGDMRAVVVGLEKVTAAVQKMEASNVRATVAAAEHVGDEVKIASSKQEDAARRSRLMAA